MFSSIFCLVRMYNINACDSWTFISNGYLVSLLFYFLLGNNLHIARYIVNKIFDLMV